MTSSIDQSRVPALTLVALAPEVAPRCLGCDYALSHLPEPRCPECGRAFDGTDPRTYHRGRPMPPWLKAWLRPIGWPSFVVAGLAWLALSFLLAQPDTTYMCIGPILGLFAWPFLLGVLGLRVLVRNVLTYRYRRSRAEFGSEGQRMAPILIAFALLHASSLFAIPTRAWFLLFMPMFDSAAAEARAITPESAWFGETPLPTQTRWIGPWRVRVQGVGSQPGVVAFYTPGDSGVLHGGGSGFVHVPGHDGMIGYNEGADGWIIGDWYYFTTD